MRPGFPDAGVFFNGYQKYVKVTIVGEGLSHANVRQDAQSEISKTDFFGTNYSQYDLDQLFGNDPLINGSGTDFTGDLAGAVKTGTNDGVAEYVDHHSYIATDFPISGSQATYARSSR